tara:strand:+ start:683 stop:904 length:222 start_codon:yes stop_codon:yes gene_type:complete
MSQLCETIAGSCLAPWIIGGAALGIIVEVLIGDVTGQLGIWISIGTAMGICFGTAFSSNSTSLEDDSCDCHEK